MKTLAPVGGGDGKWSASGVHRDGALLLLLLKNSSARRGATRRLKRRKRRMIHKRRKLAERWPDTWVRFLQAQQQWSVREFSELLDCR